MPTVSVHELCSRLGKLLPPDAPSLEDPEQPVVLIADLGGGTRRAITCNGDVQELVAKRGAFSETVDIEVRDLFPQPGSQPYVVAMPIAFLCRPAIAGGEGSRSPRSPATGRRRPFSAGARPIAPRSPQVPRGRGRRPLGAAGFQAQVGGPAKMAPPRSALVPMPPQLAPHTPVHPALAPIPSKTQQEAAMVPASPPSLRMLSPAAAQGLSRSPSKDHPIEVFHEPSPAALVHAAGAPPNADGRALDAQSVSALAPVEESQPRHVCQYDGRPGQAQDEAWENKTGELSTHLMEAIGLREEYENLKVESSRRRQALEWLLRTRDSVPGPYSINLKPKAEAAPQQPCFSSVAEPDLVVVSTGPKDWDKGEFWPVKTRDVPKLCDAITKLAHMEGTAAVRLQDQEVFATWRLANARRRLAEEQTRSFGPPQLIPRRILVESPWLKFGEFSQVAFRLYPHGDATAQKGNTTVFLWMAHPPGLSFTFNLRIGDTLSTAPRLWQATMIHYRMDLRWSQLSSALSVQDGVPDALSITLQVLQWHGPEENPADSGVEHHTNVSLALEMLQGAASASVAALAEQGVL